MPTTTNLTNEEMFEMFANAAVLVQGEDSYRVDYADAEEIRVTNEDTGEEYVLTYDDIDLETDLVYGLVLLNKN